MTISYHGEDPQTYEAIETLLIDAGGFIEDSDYFKGQSIIFASFKLEEGKESFKRMLQNNPLKYRIEVVSALS